MIPQWQYNELQQVGTDYTDSAHVEAYDQQMQKLRDIKKEIEYIIDCLNLKPGHTILEFGTGTGEFAIEAAKHCTESPCSGYLTCHAGICTPESRTAGY